MSRSYSNSLRLVFGGVAGAGAWLVIRALLRSLPVPVSFLLTWLVFTFGPGIAAGGYVARGLAPLHRFIVLMGVGSAATPVLIDVLGRANLIEVFPFLAAAFAGAGLAVWGPTPKGEKQTTWADRVACAGLVVLAVGLGAIVFWHRLAMTPEGIVLYGDYDSADLGYYAAEAAEASHTVPPMAAYYSGHRLNAAYYPHLVLGMVHRFAEVPVLSMYYGLAWPTFAALLALTAFALVRLVAAWQVAALAVALILAGSDFSYLAAWYLPHEVVDWDYLLWPTNFLSPTMQVLQFATWTPSLPVFFTTLFAIVRGLQTRERGWLLLSAALMAVLFQFKPFSYAILLAALCASALFSGRDWTARWRFAATAGLGLLLTTPFLFSAATLDPGDRRTKLVIDFFLLPRRMLIKLGLTEQFAAAAERFAPTPWLQTPLLLFVATVVFLVVGVGVRWLGAPGVWRAVRRGEEKDSAPWRLLGWGVVAGIAVPFVLTTDPYVDTLQFYVTGLFLMWIFTALALVAFARSHPWAGLPAVALAVALTLPSSVHYLTYKWSEQTRQPRASLSRAEMAMAQYLRTCDAEKTVILHDRPLSPSLMTIVSARRIVLGWDVRYSAVGGEERLRDVNRFFDSANGNPEAALDTLRRYKVTHVIVRQGSDAVHADVLSRLQPVLRFPDVTLYAVPDTL